MSQRSNFLWLRASFLFQTYNTQQNLRATWKLFKPHTHSQTETKNVTVSQLQFNSIHLSIDSKELKENES